ncbi:MAG: serine/threonine protein kinase [Myxococcaceae bacterium]|nr:serine/threonine protein kinase [Myxococcaceae bacterium]
MNCPTEDALIGYLHDPAGAGAVEAHVSDCGDCTAVLAALMEAPSTTPRARLPKRYEVESLLGGGASGQVYLARDTLLDRRVALKVRQWTDADGSQDRETVLQEARALAAVSHPNVVQVYDCFDSGDGLVLAMEFVEGETLRRRLVRPIEEAEATQLLLQAGQGLAAVHTAGLVHGDFKPENVLLGNDGRVRVADFGLSSLRVHPSLRGLTPAYASPELRIGAPGSPAADQYAFCITLWEALRGRRPSQDDLGGFAIPRRSRDVLRRGLQPAADQRFPSMAALLAELRRPRWHPRNPRRAAAALGAVVVLTFALLAARWATAAKCRSEASAIETLWSTERSDRLRHAFGQAGAEATAFEAFERGVRAFANAWQTERLLACRAGGGSGSSAESRCLDEQLEAFRSLADAYEAPTHLSALDAPRAVRALPSPLGCRAALGEPREASAATAALATIVAAKETGHAADVTRLVPAARELAQASHRTDVEAQLELIAGEQLFELGEAAAAEASLFRAAELAEIARLDVVGAQAWTALGRRARLGGRLAEAERWLSLAEAYAQRSAPVTEVAVMGERVQLLAAQRQFSQALRLQARAIDSALQLTGADSLLSLEQSRGKAKALYSAERFDEAAAVEGPLVERYRRVLGPRHLLVGKVLEHYAAALTQLQRPVDAEVALQGAGDIFVENLGTDALPLIEVLGNRSELMLQRGRPREAEGLAARAEALARRRLGDDSPRTHWAIGQHGVALGRAGHTEASITSLLALLGRPASLAEAGMMAGFAADLGLELSVAGRPAEVPHLLSRFEGTPNLSPRVEAKLLIARLVAERALDAPRDEKALGRLLGLGSRSLEPVFREARALLLARVAEQELRDLEPQSPHDRASAPGQGSAGAHELTYLNALARHGRPTREEATSSPSAPRGRRR